MSETGTNLSHTLAIFCFCMPVRINKFGHKTLMELTCVRVRAEEQESAFFWPKKGMLP